MVVIAISNHCLTNLTLKKGERGDSTQGNTHSATCLSTFPPLLHGVHIKYSQREKGEERKGQKTD